ncbi:MAG TPA: PAS domain S-box protein [Anaerolineales bacterium]|nr:PAS domain S-box protein [Anaerolineales bacterium]
MIWYLLIGVVWIALSDRVLAAFVRSPVELTIIQTYKGWLFVIGSAAFMLYYLSRENRIREDAEREFERVFGEALEGIFHSDLQGRYLEVNPALARMYGYDSPQEMLETVTDAGMQLHVEPRMFDQYRNNLLRHERIENFEAQHRRKNGTIIWTSTTARTVKDTAGGVSYIEGFVSDITTHKNSETALLEHEQQYRLLFEGAPIGIGVIDRRGRILAFNDAILEPGGYTRDDIEELQSVDKLYARRRDRARILQMARAGKPVTKEHVQFKRKDGSTYDALLTLAPVQYRGLPATQALVEDITARLLMERTLAKEQARFQVLIENSIDGTALYSRDGMVIYESPAITRILGYEPEEVYGRDAGNYVHPDDAQALMRAYGEILAFPDHVVTTVVRMQHKDGRYRWLEIILSNRLDHPDIGALVANYRDITERKRVDEELRSSEEQYRLLVENSPYAIVVHSDGQLVYVNEAAVRLLGAANAGELIGFSIIEFVHRDSRAAVLKRLKDLQTRGNGELKPLQEKFMRRDGCPITVEVIAYPFTYQKKPAMQIAMRDLTAQKRAEEALRANEERLRAIVDHTQNIYYSHSPDYVMTYVSGQVLQILGYRPDEIQRTWAQILTDHPMNRRAVELTEKAIETGIAQESYVLQLRAKDGRHVWVEVRETPVVRDGETVSIVGALTDITDRKKTDEDLQQRLAELTVLHAVAMAGSESNSEDEVIKRTTQVVSGMLYPDNCGVFLLNEARTALRPDGSYWGATFGTTMREMPLTVGITGRVASSGQPIRVGDVTQSADYVEATQGIQSEICVPIRVNERVIGAFNVESRMPEAFDEEDERLLTTIAGMLGNSIERMRLLASETQQRLEAENLRRATAALASTIELDELFEIILQSLSQLVPFTSASIELVEDGHTRIAAARGLPKEHSFIGRVSPVNLSAWGEDYRKPVIIADVREEPRFEKIPGTEYIRGWMGVPMIAQDRVIGYLNMDSETPGFYTADHAALIQIFANQAAIAIENARGFQEERSRTRIIQALADIANEFAMTEELQHALDNVARRTMVLLKASHVAIYLLQSNNETVKVVSAQGTYADQLLSHSLKIGEGITGSIVARGTSEIINDTRHDPRTKTVPGTPVEDGEQETMMSSALILRGKPVGAINAWRLRTDGLFNESELNFLISIAHQTSISIEASRLLRETSRRAQEAAAIAEVGRDISATLQLDLVLDRIAAYAQDLLNAETSAVYIYEAADEQLHAVAAKGIDSEEVKNDPVPLGRGISGDIALSKVGEIVNYAPSDPRALTVAGTGVDPLEHFMGVPILSKEQLTGLLVVWRTGADREFKSTELVFLSSLAQQAAVAIENARLFQSERRRREEAENLQVAATAVTSSLDVEEVLETILVALKQVTPYDSAAMFLLEGNQVRIRAAKGLQNPQLAIGQLFPASNQLFRSIQRSGKAVIVEDAQLDPRFERWAGTDHTHGWLGVPLIARGQIMGYITLDSNSPCAFNENDAALAQTFAHQAAAAIDNAGLFMSLERSNEELSRAYDTTLEGWGNALELRDKETQGHTRRVADLTLKLARQVGIRDDDQLIHLRRGVLVHDIGKMGVPDRILHKKTPLNKKEWEQLRRHPQYAFDLLYPIAYLRPAIEVPYCHHERWDGKGYPRGLIGDEIPLAARVFSIVDVWDALLSDRSYRKAWPRQKVLNYIREQAGTLFDPRIAEVFVRMMELEHSTQET